MSGEQLRDRRLDLSKHTSDTDRYNDIYRYRYHSQVSQTPISDNKYIVRS